MGSGHTVGPVLPNGGDSQLCRFATVSLHRHECSPPPPFRFLCPLCLCSRSTGTGREAHLSISKLEPMWLGAQRPNGPPTLGFRTHMSSSLGGHWVASGLSLAPLGLEWFSFLSCCSSLLLSPPQPPPALPGLVLHPRGLRMCPSMERVLAPVTGPLNPSQGSQEM